VCFDKSVYWRSIALKCLCEILKKVLFNVYWHTHTYSCTMMSLQLTVLLYDGSVQCFVYNKHNCTVVCCLKYDACIIRYSAIDEEFTLKVQSILSFELWYLFFYFWPKLVTIVLVDPSGNFCLSVLMCCNCACCQLIWFFTLESP
jgi:hypothetical protein